MIDKLDVAYSAIGAALSDDEIKDLVKKSTGMNLTDLVGERDPPKKKIEKVIDFLKNRGNQRWLLTRVLLHAAAEETVRHEIMNAFPGKRWFACRVRKIWSCPPWVLCHEA